ncbi:MAG: MerR family DNA-binding transcriptional regulator [Rhodobacteraceae bacterium]|nr:MerR family DNA-binding transcriptional regulator [Paracoccaceae bacterium]
MRDTIDCGATQFSIRELCDAFEVTPRTLRFYESQELLSPRREGARRVYSLRDRARLRLILRGKRFGFSLAEIRELLDLYDMGDGQLLQLEKTLTSAYEKRDQLEAKRRDLNAAIEDFDQQIRVIERMLAEKKSDFSTAV